MITERLRFYSDGLRLDGELWLPDERAPLPAVVACSGYQGLKDIHPARFARALAPRGIAVLGFDYRGFGWSEGERGALAPLDQADDVRAAVSVLEADPRIDGEHIGLLGWALGGGVAIEAAAGDERVTAVATINAVGHGGRTTRATHDADSWDALQGALAEDRVRRARDGRSALVPAFEALRLGDGSTAAYVDAQLDPVPGFGTDVTLETVERLLRFDAEPAAAALAPRPLLLLHGTANDLYAFDESRGLHAAAGEPKALVPLDGAGHTEWMHDDDPLFGEVVERLSHFFTTRELDDGRKRT